MGEKINLVLDERKVHGKKVKTLRREGIIPVVVYGSEIKAQAAQIHEGIFNKAYKNAGRHTPVTLELAGKKHIAMIKDVDVDSVTHRKIHVSFHAVKASDPVIAEVPIRLVGEGESLAEKEGLVILQALEQIEVRALPMDLPEALELSIVEMKEAGDRVTIGDIKLPEGVEIVERHDGRAEDEEDEERPSVMDLVVASVYEPGALQAANEAAAGDAETADADAVETEQGGDEAGEKAETEAKES